MKKALVATAALVLAVCVEPALAGPKTITVHVIDRQQNSSDYSVTLPAQSYTSDTASASCTSYSRTATCSGSGFSTTTVVAGREHGYTVRGATLTLELPDARVVLVNCESKYAPRGDYINRRSCRVPLDDVFEVEFNGEKAKLYWRVSLDGRKWESETYKILAIR